MSVRPPLIRHRFPAQFPGKTVVEQWSNCLFVRRGDGKMEFLPYENLSPRIRRARAEKTLCGRIARAAKAFWKWFWK